MIMRKLTTIALSLAMVVSMTPAVAFATDQEEPMLDSLDNELIVVYKDDAQCTQALEEMDLQDESENTEEIEKLSAKYASDIVEESGVKVESSQFLGSTLGDDGAVQAITIDGAKNVDDVISSIEKEPEVAYVQPNYQYELLDMDADFNIDDDKDMMATAPNDKYAVPQTEGQVFQYGLFPWDSIYEPMCGSNVANAWDLAKCNGSVTVAVIDSGVDMKHPDLVNNIDWRHAADATCNPVKNIFIDDKNGHGTHVAGVISATVNNSIGVAGSSYNANILPIKVLDDYGRISTTSLVRAYMYLDNLVENKLVTNLHVINISIGGYTSGSANDTLLENAIIEMKDKHNVLTVCAGGNSHRTDRIVPGDCSACLCVTALNYKGQNTCYSDYNQSKDISAPGGEIDDGHPNDTYFPIVSTKPGGDYFTLCGTSQAAPLVSGIMALLWTVKPDLTVGQAVEAVKATAHDVKPRDDVSFTGMGSAGAIDAAAAIEYIQDKWFATRTNIAGHTITLGTSTYTYNGLARKPSVSVSGLTQGTDYTVTYVNNVSAGKATAVVKGIGKYYGTIAKSFTIKPVPITSASLSTTNYVYSGGIKRPLISIYAKVNGKTIKAASNLRDDSLCFDVSYSTGRKVVGKHAVRVKARGNYTGTITKYFTITPKPTEIKSVTKSKKAFTVKWGLRTKQVTGYQIMYSTSSKFTKSTTKIRTIKDNSVTSKKISKLKSKKYYYVKVRTYKEVGSDKHRYYSKWTSRKKVKTK